MTTFNPVLANSLRTSFRELHTVADDGLAALGPDENTASVDLEGLRRANEKLRQLVTLILAAQDQEER
jgi:hypothetical protein